MVAKRKARDRPMGQPQEIMVEQERKYRLVITRRRSSDVHKRSEVLFTIIRRDI